MPQPLSQKREMRHVLQKVVGLESEPEAFQGGMMGAGGGAGGDGERKVGGGKKKHLGLIFGMLVQALKAAKRDEEMAARLRDVVEAVAGMGV